MINEFFKSKKERGSLVLFALSLPIILILGFGGWMIVEIRNQSLYCSYIVSTAAFGGVITVTNPNIPNGQRFPSADLKVREIVRLNRDSARFGIFSKEASEIAVVTVNSGDYNSTNTPPLSTPAADPENANAIIVQADCNTGVGKIFSGLPNGTFSRNVGAIAVNESGPTIYTGN
ncbi:MAG: hypothetical protein R3A13_12135 [Bdellovibrionota bacterium]